MLTEADRIEDARGRALNDLRTAFYGAGALKLEPVEDRTGTERLKTNGHTMKYNPAWTATQTDEDLISGMCHEAGHCLFGHVWRLAGRDPEEWNISGDIIVNNALKAAGIRIPDTWLTDDTIGDMSTEALYAKRMAEKAAQQPPPAPEEQPEPEDGEEDPAEEQAPEDPGESDDQGEEDGDPEPGEEPAEEDAEGEPEPGAGAEEAPAPAAQVESGPGMMEEPPEGEPEADQGVWEIFTQAAVDMARRMGTLPAGADRLVKAERERAEDWRQPLNRFLEPTAPSDYSWQRPNRYRLMDDYIVPGLHFAEMPKIRIIVDTSGSVVDAMLKAMAEHINSVMSQLRPKCIEVVYVDAEVQGSETFYPDGDPVVLAAKGGGGTMLQPGLDFEGEDFERPACHVYMTDLAASDLAYLREPAEPVLWVTPTWVTASGPFGDTIRMDLGSEW